MRWGAALPATDPLTLGLELLFVFLAAVVRGYSGFGFSLLAITGLSLVLPPATVVPSLYMLEIAASAHLVPAVWKDIHWRSIWPLLAGCLIGTPIGVWFLSHLPTPPMQIALGVVMLASAFMLLRGFTLRSMPGTAATVATGTVSGLLNGAFSTAGPPVILFYFSSPAGAIAGRASMIAYFFGTDVIGMPLLAHAGLITWDTFIRALLFLPPLMAGIWLGARSFRRADPARFRQYVLKILAVLALMTTVQGVLAMTR
jgi:uncharacterized protein